MNLKYTCIVGLVVLALCVMPAVSEPVEIYSGEITLADELVTITTSQGDTFEIPAATPLGILELLTEEGVIESFVASSKSYEKKGILLLDGINEYQYSGDTTWFVTVDDYQLEDFVNNETDGLNIYEIPAGAEVSFWYGLPILPIEEAEVVITVSTVGAEETVEVATEEEEAVEELVEEETAEEIVEEIVENEPVEEVADEVAEEESVE